MPFRTAVGLLAAAALAACSASSGPTDPSSPSGVRLNAFAEPPALRAAPAGATVGGCAQVTAELLDAAGRPVDGVPVRFAATLGTFDGVEGDVARTVTSVRGIAAVTFCAGAQRGTGMVAVAAENAATTVLIPIT